jgi:hypothetical protein
MQKFPAVFNHSPLGRDDVDNLERHQASISCCPTSSIAALPIEWHRSLFTNSLLHLVNRLCNPTEWLGRMCKSCSQLQGKGYAAVHLPRAPGAIFSTSYNPLNRHLRSKTFQFRHGGSLSQTVLPGQRFMIPAPRGFPSSRLAVSGWMLNLGKTPFLLRTVRCYVLPHS